MDPMAPAAADKFLGMSNTSDFILMKEDHTMGNLISEHLKQSPHVIMAGYKGKDLRACRRLYFGPPVLTRGSGSP